MSFALTTPQILNRSKTVTRRIGWWFLKPGTLIQAVEKGMGLQKGEKMHKLAVLRIKDVRRERLDAMMHHEYGPRECVAEGFPDASPGGFIYMFCSSHRVPNKQHLDASGRVHYRPCEASDEVTRIEFEYVDEAATA
jgi:hypothetical protein